MVILCLLYIGGFISYPLTLRFCTDRELREELKDKLVEMAVCNVILKVMADTLPCGR